MTAKILKFKKLKVKSNYWTNIEQTSRLNVRQTGSETAKAVFSAANHMLSITAFSPLF
jgi:hypothetical protein